ncbi:MAG TPA: hypothetical protein VH165_36285 [Kofleriaceae bacterium]|jgi:hypothetical protein|nr:hypothetical protein [Kofleriaceae bacterium]
MTRASWLLMYLGATALGCSTDGPITEPHVLDGGGGGPGSPGFDGGGGGRDAGIADGPAGFPVDAGSGVPFPGDAGPLSVDAGGNPTLLSMQGVYGDFAQRALPSDAITYDVRWPLWTDGATKRRWLILPAGAGPIDNTDQDHWKLPIGARLIKEFRRNGVLVETRILQRIGPEAADYTLRTFVWNPQQTEATLTTDGATNVNGTGHDVPQASDCWTCHEGEPGMALGFSALQLSPATLAALSSAGRLARPVAPGTVLGPTGAAGDVAALGYLHGNCGHCHNPTGFAAQFNNQVLRLDTASEAADQEPGWRTTVGVAVQGRGLGATERVDPGDAAGSAIIRRMSIRGDGQMPFLGTEIVDPTGILAVSTWINNM